MIGSAILLRKDYSWVIGIGSGKWLYNQTTENIGREIWIPGW